MRVRGFSFRRPEMSETRSLLSQEVLENAGSAQTVGVGV